MHEARRQPKVNRSKWICLGLLLFAFVFEGLGQINRSAIRRSNKMYRYRGEASPFAKHKRYLSVGAALNLSFYYGDISPVPKKISTNLTLSKPGGEIFVMYRRGPKFSMQGALVYAPVSGSDTKSADPEDLNNGIFRYRRNLSFRNRIKELNFSVVFDLLENQHHHLHRIDLNPFVFLGLGLFHNNPQSRIPQTDLNGSPLPNAGKWIALQPIGTEGQRSQLSTTDSNYGLKPYSRLQLSIPFGFGIRKRVHDNIDFSFDITFRFLLTDYLDDVSHNYVDLGVFGENDNAKALSYRSNEIMAPNHTYVGRDGTSYNVVAGYGSEHKENKRGDPNEKDTFITTSLKVAYVLGKNYQKAKTR